MAQSIKVALQNELITHKGPVKELELKEPRARAFAKHGEPFKVKTVGEFVEIDYNNDAMLNFLADMSGIDTLLLGDLTSPDYRLARDQATLLIMGIAGDRPTPA
jgi:hypothetical protein